MEITQAYFFASAPTGGQYYIAESVYQPLFASPKISDPIMQSSDAQQF